MGQETAGKLLNQHACKTIKLLQVLEGGERRLRMKAKTAKLQQLEPN